MSRDGGREPAWSGDGRELFYRRGREIVAVPVGAGPAFSAGERVGLFEFDATVTEGPTGERDWDVSPDGRRFLLLGAPRATSPFVLRVIMNVDAAVQPAVR